MFELLQDICEVVLTALFIMGILLVGTIGISILLAICVSIWIVFIPIVSIMMTFDYLARQKEKKEK